MSLETVAAMFGQVREPRFFKLADDATSRRLIFGHCQFSDYRTQFTISRMKMCAFAKESMIRKNDSALQREVNAS